MNIKLTEERHPWHDDLQEALAQVGKVMEGVVRREQHRNDLTQLPNELALNHRLEEAFTNDKEIWCAFIEVDHFKRINEIYKYEAGNAALKRVAKALQTAAEDLFGGVSTVEAYHTHGDEFYLIGDVRSEAISDQVPTQVMEGLESARTYISKISMPVGGFGAPMKFTVTIGWALKSDLPGEDATRLGFRRCIEDAVGFGKRKGRNCTVRYGPNMRKSDIFSERDTCQKCEAAFTMDVEKGKLASEPIMYCPNCGQTKPRPERPAGTVCSTVA
ncbi:MAG: GGDEF domain-containing protein [Enhygromyxa sp.]